MTEIDVVNSIIKLCHNSRTEQKDSRKLYKKSRTRGSSKR